LIASGADAETTPASLLGVMDATQSTYRDRCAEAPPAVRAAYDGDCYNAVSETGVDCAGSLADLGDLRSREGGFRKNAARYTAVVAAELERGRTPFILGGDHAITPALVAAYAGRGPIHVVQWDAHPDMYPDFEGNRDSHACVAARLLEMEQVETVTQIGIRTETGVQRQVREAAGGRVVQIPAWEAENRRTLVSHLPDAASVYLTVDMDGFDPAFAPAVAHPVPAGLSARAGLELVKEIGERYRLVGMDVVEACPDDRDNRTLILAARLIHEGVATVLDRR
jgi:agmatinase